MFMLMDRKDPKKISGERKSLYYIGMGITAIGVVLFLSVFYFVFMGITGNVGVEPDFGFMKNGFIGFILIGAGNFIMNLGAKGAAGSGLLLDPEKAREDLNPYTSAAGGMLSDALKEVDVLKKSDDEKALIRVRCRHCRELNEEDARFCKSCGKEI